MGEPEQTEGDTAFGSNTKDKTAVYPHQQMPVGTEEGPKQPQDKQECQTGPVANNSAPGQIWTFGSGPLQGLSFILMGTFHMPQVTLGLF